MKEKSFYYLDIKRLIISLFFCNYNSINLKIKLTLEQNSKQLKTKLQKNNL